MSNWHLEFSMAGDAVYCSALRNLYSTNRPSAVRKTLMWNFHLNRWRDSERLRKMVTDMIYQDDARGIMDWSGNGLQLRARCAAAILGIRLDEP